MISPYFSDLHQVFATRPDVAGILLMLCSIVSGMAVGLEREMKHKPAGIRTLSLICAGSTIFTLASILLGDQQSTDRARIAAQVVTGIGFLGAGAIIRDRGRVMGMTTGATIWAVAAIGVIIGSGYAAAGVVLTLVVIAMLTVVGRVERRFVDPCLYSRAIFTYMPSRGKTRLRIMQVLDQYHLPRSAWRIRVAGETEVLEVSYCRVHRQHRQVLYKLVAIPGIVESQIDPDEESAHAAAG